MEREKLVIMEHCRSNILEQVNGKELGLGRNTICAK